MGTVIHKAAIIAAMRHHFAGVFHDAQALEHEIRETPLDFREVEVFNHLQELAAQQSAYRDIDTSADALGVELQGLFTKDPLGLIKTASLLNNMVSEVVVAMECAVATNRDWKSDAMLGQISVNYMLNVLHFIGLKNAIQPTALQAYAADHSIDPPLSINALDELSGRIFEVYKAGNQAAVSALNLQFMDHLGGERITQPHHLFDLLCSADALAAIFESVYFHPDMQAQMQSACKASIDPLALSTRSSGENALTAAIAEFHASKLEMTDSLSRESSKPSGLSM